MTLTRLSKEHIIDVHLREYGRTEKHKCTFVFQPENAPLFFNLKCQRE